MKALVCREIAEGTDHLKLEDVALPPLGESEVRIRVRAASVNFPDLLMAQGKYQFKPELPFVVGGEAAGDVIAVGGGISDVRVGERVIVGGTTGAFAQEMQASHTAVRPIPAGVDYAGAASFTVAYLTAYVALVRRGELQRDETLLVHGAAGGVGLAAADLGKLLGAQVIATASTEEKRAFLKNYGADHVLPPQGFREAVKALTGGRGADVIYDPVGGDVFDESVRCIAFGGRILVVGFASGRIPTLGVNMPLIKGFSVVGVRAGEYGRKYPGKGRENIETLDRWLSERKIRPHIGARFPLSGALDAMRTLQSRKIIGKAVIEP